AADAVAVALRAGKACAVADLGSELDECVGGRDPLELQSVAAKLAAEKSLVRKRGVVEVPCVLGLIVGLTERRQEAPATRGEPVGPGGQQAIGLFDLDAVIRRKRKDQIAEDLVVDVGGQRELGFRDREAALRRRDVAAWHEAVDDVLVGVLRE